MTTLEWWAEGDLFEGCNCNVVCPCHADFRQNSTHDTCDNLWGIHIDAGAYGGLDLSGLNALVVAASPGPSMFAGNWTALVFVDERAAPEQYTALEEILSGRAGGPWERMARFYADGSAAVLPARRLCLQQIRPHPDFGGCQCGVPAGGRYPGRRPG